MLTRYGLQNIALKSVFNLRNESLSCRRYEQVLPITIIILVICSEEIKQNSCTNDVINNAFANTGQIGDRIPLAISVI